MAALIWAAAAVVVAALAAIYLLVLTEGTYLGTRVVVWLYDLTAKRYDGIKKVRYVNEAHLLGIPLAEALGHIERPLVLDVATGTGRLPLVLCRVHPEAVVVGVERSRDMLAQAQRADAEAQRLGAEVNERALWLRGDAQYLPLADGVFDGATCLEAFEFLTAPRRAIAELWRVLRPGGVLLVSNRIGPDAWFFVGRAAGRGRLERRLGRAGFIDIRTRPWQVHYDLIWAVKPAQGDRKG